MVNSQSKFDVSNITAHQGCFQSTQSSSFIICSEKEILRQLQIFLGVDCPANSPQGQTVQGSGKVQKNPKTQSQTLQASVTMLNGKTIDSAVRKRLKKQFV
ncbi:hypothetical protein AMECASPLE_009039 [Ameca splendens]|uniref:Uncharacterized protein n=1 Tax=Ameca splendens TaxID=208324 RepID=A0ABV0YY54_9TELE